MRNDREETIHSDVSITLRFADPEDAPVEGLSISLRCDPSGVVDGSYDEMVTDEHGEVEYHVPSWQKYAVFIGHDEFDEIHVKGSDATFEFEWESDEDWDDDGDVESGDED